MFQSGSSAKLSMVGKGGSDWKPNSLMKRGNCAR